MSKAGSRTKGLRCQVWRRSPYDWEKSGPVSPQRKISDLCDSVVVIGDGIPESDEPTEDSPAMYYVARELWGKPRPYVTPIEGAMPQFGGNYVFSSAKGFPFDYPVPIHDRYERRS
jgi:hypothetical protein